MSTIVLEHVPDELWGRIHSLAVLRRRTPSEAVVEFLDDTLPGPVGERLPDAPFMTDEISAPFDLPRPAGTPIFPREIPQPFPDPREFPDEV